MNNFCNEKKAVGIIYEILKKGKRQFNNYFESDSEILNFDLFAGKNALVNIDEFSCEDLLYCENPYILGYNCAVGAISDIFACGGIPVFYGHSISAKWSEKYLRQFICGIKDVLENIGADFIGGDFSLTDNWRYTATVIGKPFNKPITRIGCRDKDLIFLTGETGKGNLQAFMNLQKKSAKEFFIKNNPDFFKFNIRRAEAEIIAKYANACIDTSDGLLNALIAISEPNGAGFILTNIPYLKEGRLAAEKAGLNEFMLAAGEAGEYELLFTISPSNEKAALKDFAQKKMNIFKIGEICCDSKTMILKQNNYKYDIGGIKISARDYSNPEEYLKTLTGRINNLKLGV